MFACKIDGVHNKDIDMVSQFSVIGLRFREGMSLVIVSVTCPNRGMTNIVSELDLS